jgi:hypothetical protein
MKREINLPTREEAFATDLPFYGEVEEIFIGPYADGTPAPDTGELLGAQVNIKVAETGNTMLGSTTYREYFRLQSSYERSVRKEVKRAAEYIGHSALILSAS